MTTNNKNEPKPTTPPIVTYSQQRLTQILNSLYQSTSRKKYERALEDPGTPEILLPDNKEPKPKDFQAAAADMLANLTVRQIEVIVKRVGTSKGRGISDEEASADLEISKKRVRELERNVFDAKKMPNATVRRCIVANLMVSRKGITKPVADGISAEIKDKKNKGTQSTQKQLEKRLMNANMGDFEIDSKFVEKFRQLIVLEAEKHYITKSEIADILPESLLPKDLENISGMLITENLTVLDSEPNSTEFLIDTASGTTEEEIDDKTEAAIGKLTGIVNTSSADSTRMYMREMNNHVLLKREQETDIAVFIECCLRSIVHASTACQEIIDFILQTCDKLVADEIQAKDVLNGIFETDVTGESLHYHLRNTPNLTQMMKPIIADKNEAFITPEPKQLIDKFVKVSRKIKEFRTKSKNVRKGSAAHRSYMHNLEKWLLKVRFSTPFIKRLANMFEEFRSEILRLKREMKEICSRSLNIKVKEFEVLLRNNLHDPDWIIRLGKQRNFGPSYENERWEIVARHRQLLEIIN